MKLLGFHKIDMEVKHLELIHKSLNDDIETFVMMMEDKDFVDDLQSSKEVFAAFAMEMRRSTYQVDKVVDALKELADDKINEDNHIKAGERIKRVNNYQIAKEYAEVE